MAKQTINVGTTANDGTGDTLRAAAVKANENFDELYDKFTTLVNPADAVAGDYFLWNGYVYGVVEGANGTLWLDRNLGAARVAQSATDPHSYGDLYQWGRPTDGHQQRTSKTTETQSSTDTPVSNEFVNILSFSGDPNDWRNPQNDDLWQGLAGTNNPAPTGWRLPTETELTAEKDSWSSANSAGAFASALKLPVAGYRRNSDGLLQEAGSGGLYWSSTINDTLARSLAITSSSVSMSDNNRAHGHSIRCIKDV